MGPTPKEWEAAPSCTFMTQWGKPQCAAQALWLTEAIPFTCRPPNGLCVRVPFPLPGCSMWHMGCVYPGTPYIKVVS